MINEFNQSPIPESVLSLFKPVNQVKKDENDDIDFGARFFKPPPVSTTPLPTLNSHDSAFDSDNSNRSAANNTPEDFAFANLLVNNSTYGYFDPRNKVYCSTPINLYPNLIMNSNARSATNNRSDYNSLSNSNCVQYSRNHNNNSHNNSYSRSSNYSPVSPKSFWNNERKNSSSANSLYDLNYSNAKSYSKQQQFGSRGNLLNSYSSGLSQDDEDSFDKHWQDKKKPSVLYSAYTGVYMDAIHRQARLHRNAAQYSTATCTWRGQLLTRRHKNPILSCKVFLGGVPWDINEQSLIATFSKFGSIKIQWPGKDIKCTPGNSPSKCGYVYVVFERQDSVRALLKDCIYDDKNGGKWFYNMPTKRMPLKEVQVVPWILADSNWVKNPSQRLDPRKTVFVGALHGMTTAEGLARIMDDLFGNVVYVGIDTDKNKSPVGSSRVSFSTTQSYIRAVMAGFVEIKSNKFNKKIQIDPYLESSNCSYCHILPGPVFCRSLCCFRYFCVDCFYWIHSHKDYKNHYPIMRNKREQR